MVWVLVVCAAISTHACMYCLYSTYTLYGEVPYIGVVPMVLGGTMAQFVLPKHIIQRRIGVGESECSSDGGPAPRSWKCGCGSWIMLELVDFENDAWIPTDTATLNQFLADHANHKPLCWKCSKVEVEFVDGWCDACEEADTGW